MFIMLGGGFLAKTAPAEAPDAGVGFGQREVQPMLMMMGGASGQRQVQLMLMMLAWLLAKNRSS